VANELIERLRDAELYDLDGWESGLPLDAAHALEAADRMADAIEAYFNGDVGSAWKLDVEDTLAAYRATQKDD